MKSQLIFTFCTACMLLPVAGIHAQTPPKFDISKLGMAPHNFALHAVQGKPYSLTETRTSIEKQSNGTTQTTVFVVHRMRDSEGRERSETSMLRNGVTGVPVISLMDPVGHFTAVLISSIRTALVTHYAAPKALSPEEQAAADEKNTARMKMLNSLPSTPDHEKLPPQTIAGVVAQGERLHLVLGGAQVTEETWYSPELKIQVKSYTDDPRIGQYNTIVSDLERKEPDPSLFRIPDDYKVESYE
jgi:hypothetical protein